MNQNKNLNIRATCLSDKAHWLLNRRDVNKSQLVNILLEKEAEKRGFSDIINSK